MSSRTFSAAPSEPRGRPRRRARAAPAPTRSSPPRPAACRARVAQQGDRAAHAISDRLRHAREPGAHDLGLPLARRVVDPVVEAASLERVVQLARAVGRDDDQRPAGGAHRAELGDRHLEVREELEQEGLELVVGAVDLVDQQHHRPVVLERLEQRAADQERGREQLAHLGAALGRAEGQQLARRSPSRRARGGRRCPRSTAGGSAGRRWRRPAPWPPRSCPPRPRPRAAAAARARRRGTRRSPAPRRRGSARGQRAATPRPSRRSSGTSTAVAERSNLRPLPPPPARALQAPAPGGACSPCRRSGRPAAPCPRPPARPRRRCAARRAAPPRSACSAALARSGVEPMLVRPMRTSSHEPSAAFLTRAQTPTIAQSSTRRLNFW